MYFFEDFSECKTGPVNWHLPISTLINWIKFLTPKKFNESTWLLITIGLHCRK